MMNKMLLNAITAITLLLPINIQFYFPNLLDVNQTNNQPSKNEDLTDTENTAENIVKTIQNRWENLTDKSVTPSVTSVAKNDAIEPENTAESIEEKIEISEEALAKWKESFPKYKENSIQIQFIQTIAPAAVLIANQYGIYPSVMIAQAALESSWGQSDLATLHNNLMGTKGSWNGESVTARTREDVNGESIYINAGFSVYDSWSDSLYRYGYLMRNGLNWDPEYYQGTWRKNTDSYLDATAWLQGRYATDTSYANKLNQTIHSFSLDQYDSIESLDEDLEELLTKLNTQHEENL